MQLTRQLPYALSIGVAAIAGYYGRGQLPSLGWLDYAFLASFVALFSWCLSPSRSAGHMGIGAHEGTRQGIAFRLGKSLHRAFRRG